MNIVQFPDGTFSLRKFSWLYLGYVYKDLCSPYWWQAGSEYFPDCKGTLEQVKKSDPRCIVYEEAAND